MPNKARSLAFVLGSNDSVGVAGGKAAATPAQSAVLLFAFSSSQRSINSPKRDIANVLQINNLQVLGSCGVFCPSSSSCCPVHPPAMDEQGEDGRGLCCWGVRCEGDGSQVSLSRCSHFCSRTGACKPARGHRDLPEKVPKQGKDSRTK